MGPFLPVIRPFYPIGPPVGVFWVVCTSSWLKQQKCTTKQLIFTDNQRFSPFWKFTQPPTSPINFTEARLTYTLRQPVLKWNGSVLNIFTATQICQLSIQQLQLSLSNGEPKSQLINPVSTLYKDFQRLSIWLSWTVEVIQCYMRNCVLQASLHKYRLNMHIWQFYQEWAKLSTEITATTLTINTDGHHLLRTVMYAAYVIRTSHSSTFKDLFFSRTLPRHGKLKELQ